MPVLDHATHESTVASAQGYGCKNKERKNGYWAQDGWDHSGTDGLSGSHPSWVWIDDNGSTDCRYDLSLKDERCEGCTKRGQGEEYDQRIRSDGK
jgi:hypothetical protein